MSKSYPIMQCAFFRIFPRISAESLFGVARIGSVYACFLIAYIIQECVVFLSLQLISPRSVCAIRRLGGWEWAGSGCEGDLS